MDGPARFCSQSIVYQWAFTFCDYCCPKLAMDMIRGKHCPSNSRLSSKNSEYGSVISSMRSMSIRGAKMSTLKSETGVTEAYRYMAGQRTRADQERRKKEAESAPLTIIDHSKLIPEKPIINYSASADARLVVRFYSIMKNFLSNDLINFNCFFLF